MTMPEELATDKRLLLVTFSDGRVFGIPIMFFAKNRAQYYADAEAKPDRSDWQIIFDKELVYALEDDCEEALDWASANMNWSDVQHVAVQHDVIQQPANLEREWPNAEKRLQDV